MPAGRLPIVLAAMAVAGAIFLEPVLSVPIALLTIGVTIWLTR